MALYDYTVSLEQVNILSEISKLRSRNIQKECSSFLKFHNCQFNPN